MDNLCIALERIAKWLATTPSLAVCFAEAGVAADPFTRPNPYVELLFLERGRMRMEAGDLGTDMEGGDIALLNAHFGNRGRIRSAGSSYACVSFRVAGVRELAGLGRSPLLLVGKTRDIGRVAAAYQEVCRLRQSTPRYLPETWMKSAVLRLVAVLYEELVAGEGRERMRVSIAEEALRVLGDRQSDPGLTLLALAKAVRCSPSHLGRVFRREIGVGPMAHLTQLRVRRAQHLLLYTRLGVKEIAFRVGLRDPLYFSRFFRKNCGRSPRAYRLSSK